MNGAEVIVETLFGNHTDVCCANPGTWEMYMVADIDKAKRTKPMPALFYPNRSYVMLKEELKLPDAES